MLIPNGSCLPWRVSIGMYQSRIHAMNMYNLLWQMIQKLSFAAYKKFGNKNGRHGCLAKAKTNKATA